MNSQQIILLILLIILIILTIYVIKVGVMNPDLGAKLNPPTELTAVRGAGEVRLTWQATDSTPEAEYRIYQSVKPKGPFRMLGTTRKTFYEITDLTNDSDYYFKVTATLNQVAESEASNLVRVRGEGR